MLPLNPEVQAMALCEGCQFFRDRVFHPELIPEAPDEPQKDERYQRIAIHTSYQELYDCAESCCDMCRYLRRELWYIEGYRYRSMIGKRDILDPQRISIDIFWNPLEILDDHDQEEDVEVTNHGCLDWSIEFGSDPSHEGPYLDTLRPKIPKSVYVRRADTSFEKTMELGRNWLDICISKHGSCGSNPDVKDCLPTMLLDVGIPGQKYIKLIRSEHIVPNGNTEYVALSYCWGRHENAASTTEENLAEQLRRIDTQKLPLTIRDAVKVTRAFNIKYLWVDALCIVQGGGQENHDLQADLSNMGRIYRLSLFTIAACSGEHNDAGLFSRINSSHWVTQDVHLTPETQSTDEDYMYILKATNPRWDIEVESSILYTRGWVLQDRMSATRTLFFTNKGVFWQCSKLTASECSINGESHPRKYPVLQEICADLVQPKPSPGWSMRDWLRLIERFTNKELTVRTDRLPAIQGILTDVARLSRVSCYAGTLEKHLIEGLDWFASSDRYKKPANRLPDIPSWSWLSVDQPIMFDIPFVSSFHCEGLERSATDFSLDGKRVKLTTRVQCFRIKSWSPGATVYGYLGRTDAIASSQKMGPKWLYETCRTPDVAVCVCEPLSCEASSMENKTPPHAYKAQLILDTLSDELRQGDETIMCFLWKERTSVTNNGQRSFLISAIVVARLAGSENVSRRRGWIEIERMSDSPLFQDEPREVILVQRRSIKVELLLSNQCLITLTTSYM